MIRVALVGAPNSGKTAAFTALTGAPGSHSPAPFSTTEAESAFLRCALPEGAAVVVTDLPSVARGSASGQWLGTDALCEAATSDALLVVVRCFHTGAGPLELPGVSGDALRDLEIVERELILADAARVATELPGLDAADDRRGTLASVHQALLGGQAAREMGLDASDIEGLVGLPLLSAKPVVHILNIDEEAEYSPEAAVADPRLLERLLYRDAVFVGFCARLHADAALLGDAEGAEFLAELGVDKDPATEVAYAVLRALSEGVR